MRRISWPAENGLASQEGLCFIEWVCMYVCTRKRSKFTIQPLFYATAINAVPGDGPVRCETCRSLVLLEVLFCWLKSHDMSQSPNCMVNCWIQHACFSLLSSHYIWYKMALVIGRKSSHSPLSMFYTSVLNPLDYQLLVLMICNDLESFCWLRHLLPALTHFHGNCYAHLYLLFCFRWAVCRVVESSGWNMWVGFSWAVHLERWRTAGFTVYSNLYTDVRRVAARHNCFCFLRCAIPVVCLNYLVR